MIELREASDDAHGVGGGFTFYIGAVKLPIGFTPETGRAAAERFLKLCEPHETELLAMSEEYHAKIEWNHSAPKGRNWPIFTTIKRILNRLQKQAGIIDT